MVIMPDWRELLRSDGYELMPGACPEAIDAAEAAVGMRFPRELRSLYLASDGVFDTSGQWWVIWPLGMLSEENERRRRAGGLPADLIAFGDDGTGDAFCAEPNQGNVICWHAIGARKQPLAADVATLWQAWTDGTATT